MERPPRHLAWNSIGRNLCNLQRRPSPRAVWRHSPHRCMSTGRPTSTRHPTMGAHSGKLVMSARARLERLPTGLVRGSRYRQVRDRKGPPRWKCLRARAQRVNIAEQRHSAVRSRALGWRRARARVALFVSPHGTQTPFQNDARSVPAAPRRAAQCGFRVWPCSNFFQGW